MAVAYSYSAQVNSYRNHSVVGLTPGELLLKTYDFILSALETRQSDRACRGIAELIDSLDFQYAEISAGLFRLYRYCMEETKKGNYEVPSGLLRELRETWAKAIERTEGGERRLVMGKV